MAAERWNRLHPTEPPRKSHVETCLAGHDGPVVAATDYMRNYADQVREYVQAAGRRYTVLGTDGFGRSDYRRKLRRFFEVDRWHVTVAALKALADDGVVKPGVVADAISKYGLDAERAAPWTV
jgi:pyruvate dehydrogenase E1 component